MPSLPSRLGALLALTLLGVTVVVGDAERSTAAIGRVPPQTVLSAQPGQIQIVDGETLRIAGQVVRLDGIAAPARDSDGARAAIQNLARLVRDERVECRITGAERGGRLIADCRNESTNLSSALAAQE
jgi:endonuclease YncB( thermonuclease family)